MNKKVIIRNLRHIKETTFNIPEQGVYLLAGSNGAGKTSLLACLRRIGQPHAFAHHFVASRYSDALDNFKGAEVSYALADRTVTYTYGGERWAPTPRTLNGLLNEFGYSEVVYVGATAERITPRSEDFNLRRVRSAPEDIRRVANSIFSTTKYDNLKIINLTRGSGNSAFLLQASPPPKTRYFSERNFSLGELSILKLIRDLKDCANEALVLIDELELALHPKAQVALLDYLNIIAEEKQLTVIFSTHSVSLLKTVPRKNVIFLENNDGVISALSGCYPTYALGGIAYDEERAPDVVIYVEDDAALHFVEQLSKLVIHSRFQGDNAKFPTLQVIPIGTFDSVIKFLVKSRGMLPASTKAYALLDADVKNETLAVFRRERNHTKLAEFQRNERNTSYLPATPEVGLINWLQADIDGTQRLIRGYLGDNRLTVRPQDIGNIPQQAGGEQRRACKAAVANVIAHLSTFLPNANEEHLHKSLFEVYATAYFNASRNEAMALIAPMLA